MQRYARAVLLSAAKRCRCMHVALIAACAPLTIAEECTSKKRNTFSFCLPRKRKKQRGRKRKEGWFSILRDEEENLYGGKTLTSCALLIPFGCAARHPGCEKCQGAMPTLKGSAAAPSREVDGTLVFADSPSFRPNLRPDEVLRLGSFGGGYFRTIRSAVTKQTHTRAWEEFPPAWFDGIDIRTCIASDVYNPAVNKYGVRSGKTNGARDAFGLDAWEQSGWIVEQDPYGWFQWYCRFFLGRRSLDDDRQIGRWEAMCGAKGRWKRNLIARCVRDGKAFDDYSCSPVVRQTLQHWAYQLTGADFCAYQAEIAAGAKTAFIPAGSMPPSGVSPDDHSPDTVVTPGRPLVCDCSAGAAMTQHAAGVDRAGKRQRR